MAITAHHPANPLKQRFQTPPWLLLSLSWRDSPTLALLASFSTFRSNMGTWLYRTSSTTRSLPLISTTQVHTTPMPAECPKLSRNCRRGLPFNSASFSCSSRMHHRGFSHTVVIVHTHSDTTTGDLWFTPNDSELGGPASLPIGSVCIPLPVLNVADCF